MKMTGLAIVLVTVGMMFGMNLERKHQESKAAKAQTEQVRTVNQGDTATK